MYIHEIKKYIFLRAREYLTSITKKYKKAQLDKTIARRYRGPFVWDFESNLQHSSVTYLALYLIFTTLHDQNYSRTLQAS